MLPLLVTLMVRLLLLLLLLLRAIPEIWRYSTCWRALVVILTVRVHDLRVALVGSTITASSCEPGNRVQKHG